MHPSTLLSLPVLRLPALSPGGDRVAYVEQRPDVATDAYVGTVHVAHVDGTGGDAAVATFGAVITALAWQDDRRLLVAVGDRLWCVASGRPPERLWQAPGAIVALAPEPGGERVAVGVFDAIADPVAPRVLGADTGLKKWDGRGPLADVSESVWLVAPAIAGGAGLSARRVGRADTAYERPAWSSDRGRLAALCRRPGERAPTARVVLLAVDGAADDASSGAAEIELTPVADIMAFAFVPGRDVLVWAARRAPYGSPVPYRLYGAAVGGAPEAWSDDGVGVSPPLILCDWRWPTSRVPFVVAPDGLSVVALVQEGGSVVARRFHRDGRSELALGGPGATVTDLDVDGASRRVAFVRATHTTIDDVFVADPDGRERRLTDAAALWPDAGAVIAPEPFTLTTTDGLSVDCMWLGPPDAAGPVPTVLAVHGGPHGAWGDNLHLEHQLLARRGIGVLWVNPRGSSGYGPAFAERVLGRWGEEDLADLMAAVDRVVADGRADPERLAIMGTSYGGFMAAWAIGLSRRFRTAVVQAPVTDLISMYGTSDIGSSFLPYELGGLDPWRDVGAMWERSPLSHVDAVTASVLLICGEHDDRCPIGQSEEYFTALRERGREVVFLRYPGESHLLAWTGTPGHRIHRQQAVVDWLVAHLHDGPARGATGPEAADGHGG